MTAQAENTLPESGVLTAHFQIIVNVHTGDVALEALTRYQVPKTKELVSPFKIIKEMREKEQMNDLAKFMLMETCDFVKLYGQKRNGGLPENFQASVNLSHENLETSGFAKDLLQIIKQSGVPPHHIKFELVEEPLSYKRIARNNLETFKEAGCGLALDDFGIGPSNIIRWKEHMDLIDTVKIDGSLIKGIDANDPQSIKTVELIIAVAREHNCAVVAEYVDKPELMQILKNMGCDCIQGFASIDDPGAPANAFNTLSKLLEGRQPYSMASMDPRLN